MGEPGGEIGFPGTGEEPEVTGFVVNKYAKITILSKGWDIHGTTNIRM